MKVSVRRQANIILTGINGEDVPVHVGRAKYKKETFNVKNDSNRPKPRKILNTFFLLLVIFNTFIHDSYFF